MKRVAFLMALCLAIACGGGGGGGVGSGGGGAVFTGVQDLPGDTDVAVVETISLDGSTLGGFSNGTAPGLSGELPVTWHNGVPTVIDSPIGARLGRVMLLAGDGSTGFARLDDGRYFRFQAGSAAQFIDSPGLTLPAFYMRGTSTDGRFLCGTLNTSATGDLGFTWTSSGGLTTYPITDFQPYGCSPDGTEVYESHRVANIWIACIRKNGVTQDLQAFAASRETYAVGKSNGGLIVGACMHDINGTPHFEAVTWESASSAPSGLGWLNSGSNIDSRCERISRDGTCIIGHAIGVDGHNTAFVWTEATGLKDCRDYASAAIPGIGNCAVLGQGRVDGRLLAVVASQSGGSTISGMLTLPN